MNPIIGQDLDAILKTPVAWERLSGKTVLITGAYGMLLSYVTWTLLRKNRQNPAQQSTIIALVRDRAKAEKRFAGFLGHDDLVLVQHDLSTKVDISGTVDFIIHGASHASPHTFTENPCAVMIPNVLGTYHLLEFARVRKVESFLYFSSGAVYGRPLVGDIENDSRVFASFIRNVVRGEPIVMNSDGTAKRSFCYISDATIGFFKVLLEGAEGNAYNVGNDESYMTIRQLADTFAAVYPGTGVSVKGADLKHKGPEEQMFMKSSKLRGLGWACGVPVADGIRRTVESYRG